MGACLNGSAVTETSRYLDGRLQDEERKDRQLIKLLFLGPGGSGKSTIFKQLQWLHGGGYSDDDKKLLIAHIHSQCLVQMQAAIDEYLLPSLQADCEEKLKSSMESVRRYRFTESNHLPANIVDCIAFIWNYDDSLRHIFREHRDRKILDESTEYFWNHLQRITATDYIPSKEDIINVRYRTTGIIEKEFSIEEHRFHIFDVGGQKCERKKWIQCFDEVRAVVFVVSLACYNHVMYEDHQTNAMVDSLTLFEQTINNKYFGNTPIILFFNKSDLFAHKIKQVGITKCPLFEERDDIKNEHDYDESIKVLQTEFKQQCKSEQARRIYMHVTCAMQEQNVQLVFRDVVKTIVQEMFSRLQGTSLA